MSFASFRKNTWYRVIALIILTLSLLLLWDLGKKVFVNPARVMGQDFTLIWAAGRLNIEAKNPYDPAQMQVLREQVAGKSQDENLTTLFFSPPWSIPLTMPFSLLPFLPARILWLIINVVVLLLCTNLLWELFGGSTQKIRISWLALLTLGPTYLVLSLGQNTPMVLLGIVGFLYFIEHQRNDWIAGLFAALVSVKPHLLYLFWLALLFWILVERRWKVLFSIGLSVIGATIVSTIFNPGIIHQYMAMMAANSLMDRITPTIGILLRMIFGLQRIWLQYLSVLLGIIWLSWYWKRHRKKWDWKQETPIIIFVSLITAPFAWTYDQILLIVALIPAWINLTQGRSTRRAAVLLAPLLILNLGYAILHRYFTDQYFIWLAPSIFVWWLVIKTKFMLPDQVTVT